MLESTAQVINWLALAAVAVVSMIVGPILQWRIAKRQTELQMAIAARQVADSIAGRRQAWIDALRSEIAEFLTSAESVTDLDAKRHALDLDTTARRAAEEQQAVHMLRGIYLKSSIALRLNPKEEDHLVLGNTIDAVSDQLNKSDIGEPIDRELIRQLHQPVVIQARIVLKKEWERVKSGHV